MMNSDNIISDIPQPISSRTCRNPKNEMPPLCRGKPPLIFFLTDAAHSCAALQHLDYCSFLIGNAASEV